MKNHTFAFAAAAAAALMTASAASAQLLPARYYVSSDGRQLPFSAPAALGGGAYPDQPNFGRLTMLYDHSDSTTPHWHSKARYGYTGPAASPTLSVLAPAMQETGIPVVYLQPASSTDYLGYFNPNPSEWWISKPATGSVENNFEIRSIETLRGFGPTDIETKMLNSSPLPTGDPNAGVGRWAGGISADSHVHIELVSVSHSALKVFIMAEGAVGSLDVGDDYHVGENDFIFTPILAIHQDDLPPATSLTTYTATFRMFDEENIYGSTGEFFFSVVVPEPASLSLLALSGIALLRRRA